MVLYITPDTTDSYATLVKVTRLVVEQFERKARMKKFELLIYWLPEDSQRRSSVKIIHARIWNPTPGSAANRC